MSNTGMQSKEQRKNELLKKLKAGNISKKEAEELKTILEQEKVEASKEGDVALVIGIAVLLGFVVKYLVDEKIIDFDKFKDFFSGKKT